MRRIPPALVGSIALILLLALPACAAPALHVGSQASYSLSVAINISDFCSVSPANTTFPFCPTGNSLFPMSVNALGTIRWNTSSVTNSTVHLNITSDLVVILGNSTIPITPRSVAESISLSTRIVGFQPMPVTGSDDPVSMATGDAMSYLPPGYDWNSSLKTLGETLSQPRPVYTIWWVNGPLSEGEFVPVLVLPGTVRGQTTVDLGSLGNRTAWTVAFNFDRSTSDLPTASNYGLITTRTSDVKLVSAFNYDQKGDLLLSSSVDIDIADMTVTTFPMGQCVLQIPGCTPLPTPATVTTQFVVHILASMKLSSTNLDLDQRATPSPPTSDSGGPQGAGAGQTPGSESGGRSSLLPPGLMVWVFGLAGVAAASVVGALALVARRKRGITRAWPSRWWWWLSKVSRKFFGRQPSAYGGSVL